MSHTRAPRPTDLVALVTFDDEVRENLAVTREQIAHPSAVPTPLSAAMGQWLHLGHRMWVSMQGRQLQGIATARELTAKHAWEVDTLLDADEQHGGEVVMDLLQQIALAAEESEVTHVLLRTRAEGGAVDHALRCGFARVTHERLWHGHLAPATDAAGSVSVREWVPEDAFASFQTYCRAFPMTARQAMAMTVDEWDAVRDRHWQERGDGALVAEVDGHIAATGRFARATGQFTLVAEPEAHAAADGLLVAIADRIEPAERHVALVAASAATEEGALRRAGMEPGDEFALLCKRIARPVREEGYARAGIPITGG
ncbi:MAG: hypothetical protein WD734_06340 [Dehalococcoidia bacterium]